MLTLLGLSAVLQQNRTAKQDCNIGLAQIDKTLHDLVEDLANQQLFLLHILFSLNNIFKDISKNAMSLHKIIIFNVENLRVENFVKSILCKIYFFKNLSLSLLLCIVLISLYAFCFTRSEVIGILSSHTEAESTKCLCANEVAVSESQSLCL